MMAKLVLGKLSLCIGMLIMIRNNTATEICITKGQEATVQSWQSTGGPLEHSILDTLFVKLNDPPACIKLDGLPENVMPLTKNSVVTCCQLPDDTSITISCNQVEAHPNFSMTNFASQGKTQKNNVIHLSYSHSHQAYYTSLSRGTSAVGTLILGSFHPSKITGGASGVLR